MSAGDHAAPPPGAGTLWDRAVAADWGTNRPIRAFFELVAQAIDRSADGTVLVTGGPHASVLAGIVSATWPHATVHLLAADEDESAAHARLSAAEPLDVIAQTADTPAAQQVRLFQNVFMHLRVNGVYVTPALVPATDEGVATEPSGPVIVANEDLPLGKPPPPDLWTLISAAQAARLRNFEPDADDEPTYRDIRGLGRHLAEVHVESKMLLITNGYRTQAKLTEAEADSVLQALPELGTELASRAPAIVSTPGRLEHNLVEDPYFRPIMQAPKMALRRYDRPICSRGQLVTRRNLLFPDSFRHHLSPRLTNIYVEESAPRFGHVRRDISDPDELAGSWFHLDSEWPDEFGHFTTEVLGRLWAWELAREHDPSIKVLTTFRHDRVPQQLLPYARALLATFDISPSDVHVFERPCRPERLYSATSMFSSYDYIHPDIAQVWDRVAGELMRSVGPRQVRAPRIFCTRPIELKRSCSNTTQVEDLFRHYGFEIISPEQFSIAEQVQLFRDAEVIGGFAGSALFSLAFCDQPKQVFTIGPDSYTARNEHMIAAVRGHDLVSIWSTADLPHPPGSWTKAAFGSSYTFDLEREGRFLQEQLDRVLDRRTDEADRKLSGAPTIRREV